MSVCKEGTHLQTMIKPGSYANDASLQACCERGMTDMIVRSTCGLCQIGCGIIIHVDNGRVVRIEGDPESPLNKGELCLKGYASLEYLHHPDRLQHPLKRAGERGGGKWLPISWDEALDTVANALAGAKEKYGAESVAFIRGAAKGPQDEYLTRFANAFGSPNLAGMAHICFIPRKNASMLTYGFYAIPDFDGDPATIIVWGNNLPETLHHVYNRMVKAVERGAKLVVVDPREPDYGADILLKLRPGSDLALALGMLNVIISENLYDHDFVSRWTTGFDELKDHVRDYTPEAVADITWVPAATINQAARLYATNKPACLQWGNGIDQGVNSFQTARAICILRAITGNLGIPGGELQWSPPPVLERGLPAFSLRDKISPEVRQRRITGNYQMLPIAFYALPQGIINAMRHGEPYPVRVAYIQGGNPLLTYSNARETYEALLSLDFLAVADMFMTPTAALADIVLPAASYLEFDSIVTPPYSLAVASIQQKVTRLAECYSDYEILRDLARKVGLGEYFWDTEEECLDFILAPAGITFEEFKKIGVLSGSQQDRNYRSQGFATPSGKVELYSSQLKEWGFDPLPTYYEPPESAYSDPQLAEEYPLVFTTWKREPYRHSGGRQITSLRDSCPEPVVMIHPETAEKLGIKDGDRVYIETKRGRIRQKAALTAGIDPRVVGVDYAWWFPEKGASALYGWAESNINILTDDKPPFNREMGSANFRGLLCKVYKM